MKNNPTDRQDGQEPRSEETRKGEAAGKPAKSVDQTIAQAGEAGSRRKPKPGEVGLANEPRPGLGARRSEAAPHALEDVADDPTDSSEPKATKHAYEEPRPDPREQAPDSLAHEEERSTGVSGHSSGS